MGYGETIGQGIERALGSLAEGIAQRRKSQADLERQARAAKAFGAFLKSKGVDTSGIDLQGAMDAHINIKEFLPDKPKEDGRVMNVGGNLVREKADGSIEMVMQKLPEEKTQPNPTQASIAVDAAKGDPIAIKANKILNPPKPVTPKTRNERAVTFKAITDKRQEAYKIGDAMSSFDFNTLSDPDIVDANSGKFKSLTQETQYKIRKRAFIKRLNSLGAEIEKLNGTIGGTFKHTPLEDPFPDIKIEAQ